MIELTVVVFLLLAERIAHAFLERRDAIEREGVWAAERQSLLNRLEAKHLGEFAALERAQQLHPSRPVKEPSENGMRPGEHVVGI